MDWIKQHSIYERKAYRIVQKHFKSILQSIPLNNASFATYEILISSNVTEDKIKAMYIEMYNLIALDYSNKVNKRLEKITKANPLFNMTLLRNILLFLSNEGGERITSVKNTFIADVINSIKEQLGENATIIDLRNAIQRVVERSQTYFKWQSLRIARTETTTAANYAAMQSAKDSNLVLEKQWISVQDNRTRIKPYDHLDMNGQKVELENSFFVGGEKIEYPGDPKASAGNTINCRCNIAFVPKRDENGDLILRR